MNKTICNYGCGEKASFFFKNGRGCCSSSPNKCKGKRGRDSSKKKGIYPFDTIQRAWLGKRTWNSGKNLSEEHKKKISSSLRTKVESGEFWGVMSMSLKERQKNGAKGGKVSGGYRRGSGYGISGRYKGVWCDSTWELAFLLYHLDKGTPIYRCKEVYKYTYYGKTYRYHPDFVVGDKIIEIKGRRTKKDMSKIKQCPVPLTVLFEEEMSIYIDYAKAKHGVKFWEKLYETTGRGA